MKCMKCKIEIKLDDLVLEIKKARKGFFGFGKNAIVTNNDWNYGLIHKECI